MLRPRHPGLSSPWLGGPGDLSRRAHGRGRRGRPAQRPASSRPPPAGCPAAHLRRPGPRPARRGRPTGCHHPFWARTSARATLWLRAGEPCAYSYGGGLFYPGGLIGPSPGRTPQARHRCSAWSLPPARAKLMPRPASHTPRWSAAGPTISRMTPRARASALRSTTNAPGGQPDGVRPGADPTRRAG